MAGFIVKFWQELKRRKVVRVAIVYALVAWVLVQVSAATFPALLLPEWSSRLVVVLTLIGFPIALVLAWAFEASPGGLRRDTATTAFSSALVSAEHAASPGTDTASNPLKLVDERQGIVVLPFSNMSENSENEFFSDGVTEEILNLLARQLDCASFPGPLHSPSRAVPWTSAPLPTGSACKWCWRAASAGLAIACGSLPS